MRINSNWLVVTAILLITFLCTIDPFRGDGRWEVPWTRGADSSSTHSERSLQAIWYFPDDKLMLRDLIALINSLTPVGVRNWIVDWSSYAVEADIIFPLTRGLITLTNYSWNVSTTYSELFTSVLEKQVSHTKSKTVYKKELDMLLEVVEWEVDCSSRGGRY